MASAVDFINHAMDIIHTDHWDTKKEKTTDGIDASKFDIFLFEAPTLVYQANQIINIHTYQQSNNLDFSFRSWYYFWFLAICTVLHWIMQNGHRRRWSRTTVMTIPVGLRCRLSPLFTSGWCSSLWWLNDEAIAMLDAGSLALRTDIHLHQFLWVRPSKDSY